MPLPVYKDVDARHKAGHDGINASALLHANGPRRPAPRSARRGAGRLRHRAQRGGARAGNRTLADKDPTAHAELLAVRAAALALGSERLTDCDLYVTLEPCAMCATAMSFARIRRLYFGAADPKGGAVEHGVRFFATATCHHRPEVYGGINESESALLLRDFFAVRR
jgi:tRNA(adenine34) deaminase